MKSSDVCNDVSWPLQRAERGEKDEPKFVYEAFLPPEVEVSVSVVENFLNKDQQF